MKSQILCSSTKKSRWAFDPRTKILLLITMTTFVLGGAGGEKLRFFSTCLCILPVFLLLAEKRYQPAVVYLAVYGAAYAAFAFLGGRISGISNFLLLGTAGIVTKFMPSIMLGVYVVSSTTVSEFTAAMQKLHMPEKIIIPMSVMFRFFPTVSDEFVSINAAMKMRDIRFGGKNAMKMLEYRLVPLLSCSVKIGEELSAAALTRGLGGEPKRTNVCVIGLKSQDFLVFLFCGAAFLQLLLVLVRGG